MAPGSTEWCRDKPRSAVVDCLVGCRFGEKMMLVVAMVVAMVARMMSVVVNVAALATWEKPETDKMMLMVAMVVRMMSMVVNVAALVTWEKLNELSVAMSCRYKLRAQVRSSGRGTWGNASLAPTPGGECCGQSRRRSTSCGAIHCSRGKARYSRPP